MATKVLMPKLSPTMEEGQISRWLKNEGEEVTMGEPLAEIDTDKATMEMQALSAGVLRKILVPAGNNARLGQPIAIVGAADEDIAALLDGIGSSNGSAPAETSRVDENQSKSAIQESPTTSAPIKSEVVSGEDEAKAAAYPASAGQSATNGASGRMLVSPLAARMATEAGIDLRSLKGSGPGGRIIKRDIETARAGGDAKPQPRAAEQTTESVPTFTQSVAQGASAYRDEPTTEMRRTIARRLVTSIGPVPHFFLTVEIEMDKLLEIRKQINGSLSNEQKISVNDFIIKAAANALVQHPAVNASFQEKAIRYYKHADIGVAVAIEDGLITPVIRAADTKGVSSIGREVKELAERARNRKLKPNEYTGASFSISNLGMFGIDEFTAVINPPEAAILAVGASISKPVARDGEIVVRSMMRVTLSCDHRVIDGATGAKFLQTFRQILENPFMLML